MKKDEQIERSIAKSILKNNNIYTLRETEEFCKYNSGFYHKGTEPLSEIRTEINQIANVLEVPSLKKGMMKPYNYSISKRNTILEIIRAESFISIKEFDKKDSYICLENGIYNFNGFNKCILPNPKTEDGSYSTIKGDSLVLGKKNFITFDEYLQIHKNPYKTFIQIPIIYNSTAEGLEIDQFLSDVFGFETVPLIYEMIAYFLMPHVRYQKAFMLYGPPSTGKTTFITLLWRFLNGLKHFSGIELQELGERFQMVNLMNTILNVFDDLPDKPIGDSKAFRQVVTNEYLDSEIKHVPEHVQWRNRTKLLNSCNTLPPVRKKEGDAFFRRWVLIGCYVIFKEGDLMSFEDEQDPNIKAKDNKILDKICTPEGFSGLLNKIIEAWNRLEERGYFPKEWNNIEYIKNLWMIDINPIGLFVDECCIVNPNEQTDYNLFYQILNKFRIEHNAKPITKHMCTQWLQRIDGVKKKRKGTSEYYYNGISINDTTLKKYAPNVIQEQEEKEIGIDDYLEGLEEESKERHQDEKIDFSDPFRL